MVSRTNFTSGRTRQKQRTRRAILDAAHRVMCRGDQPRLVDVAREAEISRATIYRYFPSEELLLIEATLDRLVPDATLEMKGDDLRDQATHVTQVFYDHAAQNESAFRMYLRAVLESMTAQEEPAQESRGGRRTEAFAKVLDPARSNLDDRTYENLMYALSALTGIEALIVMKDVCRLDEARGRDVLVWAARTLVGAAIRDS